METKAQGRKCIWTFGTKYRITPVNEEYICQLDFLQSSRACCHFSRFRLWDPTDCSLAGSSVHCCCSCSATQSCPTLCDLIDYSTPRFPVLHQLLELAQTHVYGVGDATQPSHPLSSPSPPVFNLSQHQGLFYWVSSSHQVAKVLEFQFQHQSFQWTFRTNLL